MRAIATQSSRFRHGTGAHRRFQPDSSKFAMRPARAGSAAVEDVELRQGLEKLRQSEIAGATAEEMSKQLEPIIAKAKELGLNTIFPEHNLGNFSAHPLDGKLQKDLQGNLSLGRMTFNKLQPVDKLATMTFSTSGGVYKGEYLGEPNTYAVIVPFKTVESGLQGLQRTVARWTIKPENPARQELDFLKIVIEPEKKDPETLEAWLAEFKPHNPDMGSDGSIILELDKMPHGYLDYLYMDHDYQLVKGNYGSITMFKRKE